jgi:hypothetical protein
MKFTRTILVSTLGMSLAACGGGTRNQPSAASKESAPQAKTKLEAFQAKTGVVVIRGFSTVGSLPGENGGGASVETREFTDAADGTKQYGIAIEVYKAGAMVGDERTSYLDYNEIDSLVKGIDYIAKIDRSVTKLESFQADYRTKDDLEISTFSDSEGKTSAAISSGTVGKVSVFVPLTGLDKFKNLIVQAKSKLDSIR